MTFLYLLEQLNINRQTVIYLIGILYPNPILLLCHRSNRYRFKTLVANYQYHNTVNVEIFAQFIFSHILRMVLDARKYEI